MFPQDADITTFPNYHDDISAHQFFSQVYPHIGTGHAQTCKPNQTLCALYRLTASHTDTRRQVMWEGVQEAGEILYVPSGCAHVVLTLDASVAISVDFINDVNLPFIAPHLRALICPH